MFSSIVFIIHILQLIFSPSSLQGVFSCFFNNYEFESFKYLFGDFAYEYNVFLSHPPSQFLRDIPPSHSKLHIFFFLIKKKFYDLMSPISAAHI